MVPPRLVPWQICQHADATKSQVIANVGPQPRGLPVIPTLDAGHYLEDAFWWEPGVFTASSPILVLLIARVSTPSTGTYSSDQEAANTNRN